MNILQRLNKLAANQRAVRQLNKLDNRQLADIGIQREDIAAFVRGATK